MSLQKDMDEAVHAAAIIFVCMCLGGLIVIGSAIRQGWLSRHEIRAALRSGARTMTAGACCSTTPGIP